MTRRRGRDPTWFLLDELGWLNDMQNTWTEFDVVKDISVLLRMMHRVTLKGPLLIPSPSQRLILTIVAYRHR